MEGVIENTERAPPIKKRQSVRLPLTAFEDKFLVAATAIRADPEKAERAFMARQLVQCTLPHTNPGKVEAWTRRNGNVTLVIQAGWDSEKNSSVGYPYGTIPRLLLIWMCTTAVQTKCRRLKLGNHLAKFMRELGLDPNTGGGRRSDARRLQEQMRRLFKARISFDAVIKEPHREGESYKNMDVAKDYELWWNPREPEQGALWGSWIELAEKFFEAIMAFPVPVDMRVLRAIKRSPLALDLYVWATWRVFKIEKAAFIPWEGLKGQVGAEYKSVDEFARKAKGAFRKIRAVYPGLDLRYRKGGLLLCPSPPSVAVLR